MADLVLETFDRDASLEVDAGRRSAVTITVRITLNDREQVRALIQELSGWFNDTEHPQG